MPWKTLPAPRALQAVWLISAQVPSDLQQAPRQLKVAQLVPPAWATPLWPVHTAGGRLEQVPSALQQATGCGQVTPEHRLLTPWKTPPAVWQSANVPSEHVPSF